MKTKNSIITAALTGLLFLGLAFNSKAQTVANTSQQTTADANKLNVHEITPMQFRVAFYGPQNKTLHVRILDHDRNVLFAENKRVAGNYLKLFDLSTLADGTYTFELADGKEKYSQSFDILTKTSRVVSTIN
jgi:hypothetical protein